MGLKYVPRDYQELIIDHILRYERGAVWASMGLGKTVCVLTAIDMLDMAGQLDNSTLILAPLRVAQSTWPEEVGKWAHTSHMSVSVITGTPAQRVKAVQKKADIYTMNYENLKWLSEYYKGKLPYSMVVADESTALRGLRSRQGAKRAKILAKASANTPRFIELTGTPAPNGIINLWGQMFFIDGGARLGRTFLSFTDRWFRKDYFGYSFEPLKHSQKEVEELLSDVCLSVQTKDYFDVATPIITEVNVELPAKARKIYDDVEKNMFAELDEEGIDTIEAVHAASKTMKTLQITAGAAYLEDETGQRAGFKVIHDEKIKALEEIVAEAAGTPVLVSYTFKSDLERLLKHFKKGRALDKDPKTIKDWNAGKIPILFAHPASAGHGLNLQHGGNILAFFSIGWNLEHHQQILERIGPARQKQSGYDRPVYVYYILARDTIDGDVLKRLSSKKSIQDILLDAMRRKGKGELL